MLDAEMGVIFQAEDSMQRTSGINSEISALEATYFSFHSERTAYIYYDGPGNTTIL